MAKSETYGWLIEARGDAAPTYWQGMAMGRHTFSEDHENAVRFCRKQDADAVASMIAGGFDVRVVEHAWG